MSILKIQRNTEATVSILNQIEKDKIIFLPNVIHYQLNLLFDLEFR